MVRIRASAALTCLGDGAATFAALLDGRSGVGSLPHIDAGSVNVTCGYSIDGDAPEPGYGAGGLLSVVVASALADAGLDPDTDRVPVVVGTGLRESRAIERWAAGERPVELERLHFGAAVAGVGGALGPVVTLSNACSASGHALALAHDMVELGFANHVVAAGADVMAVSMLAMIGRVAPEPTRQVRPFDTRRTGVLLGEGAAAVVVAAGPAGDGEAELLATGLSCDASHETIPDEAGMVRAMEDAYARAGVRSADVDLVVAHGTGTEQNDPAEARALRRVFTAPGRPVLTAVKGAVGHTSGAAALVNVDVALRAMREGRVPPVVGLRTPIPETAEFRLAGGEPGHTPVRLAQVNAFGFGGLNAVTLMAAPGAAR
ncbi:beta-ketoacyl synthase N-terminal-like domain-containing protein [Qaidamihabitans albus]|uniref:beta-ketoacyl synthase N-terminal-like domain-containing protein n=1 Tax=Qaidamihabitans albus TaxID=2795733 RepID=UPI0018F10A66|nr:beta-ketoacyl synthase N-terminal-like domain-containing protein [Qaidamihabitans albus]